MATIGVLLSGCGVLDGSEIHEATLTLYFLNKAGVKVVCLAPDMTVAAMDHGTKKPMGETRNIRVEAARIARGAVADVAQVKAADLDGLILPGGLGAATNLCDFAVNGAKGTVEPSVAALLSAMHAAQKPIGAICIAPVVVALALGAHHPELTIGNDPATAQGLEGTGARHVVCPVDGIVVDAANRLVSTPAYMLGPGIADIALGIEKLVAAVLDMARAS
ncbi:isoprenoid biosynthesis glyoxalase ElbB [Desulfovibrio aerotolerans]|uniref:Isoprenoid biosynthesis glyoxalase ElbB n=1 Tax=Solidesulfovibrio aerotolerans TaxID=295255 RepID=A0A7C9MTY7_9BACT|nr:isoprenoid biosynthesis glyoxalase ElbB [Solidesulfovibrio aerotolerans]MYL82234.1 isoprenoid biosynthesis glyoxalase ElbB [Solidesulfovibrio aerotolerans]